MGPLSRLLEPNNLRPFFDALGFARDVVEAARADASFLWLARRVLLPLPLDREPLLDRRPFPPPAPLESGWRSRRVAVVASGGSGATAALVGVQRAFEEAGVKPVALSASSGAVLFAGLWAAGVPAADVARFWLSLRRREYLDPDLRRLLKATPRALTGWTGLIHGDALERSVRSLVGDLRLGELHVPFTTVAWNIDLNRVEHFGTHETPDLPLARALRVAISIPIFVEPVEVNGHQYGDGGIVDIFPVRPVLAASPDVVLGVNSYLPAGFRGEDLTGWHDQSFSILRASAQLRWSGMLALAREQARAAGNRLVMLQPVPFAETRGARFYETFVERARWPEFMRAGRDDARALLAQAEARPQEERETP